MHRKLLAAAALFPLLAAGINAVQAQPAEMPKQERPAFERPTFTKEQLQNLFKLRSTIEQKSHAGRIAIAPDIFRQDGFVTSINVVQNRLAYQMIRDCKQLQIVLFEQFAFASAVGVIGQSLVDFKMVAPACQFQAIVAKIPRLLTKRFQRQVGPLTGKQSDWTSHENLPNGESKKGKVGWMLPAGDLFTPKIAGFEERHGNRHKKEVKCSAGCCRIKYSSYGPAD
jgi:hypothetical protein